MSRVPLRRQLFILAVAGILPLAILAVVGLFVLWDQQRSETLRRGLDITRALGIAVDSELQTSFSALRLMAASRSLENRDIDAFEATARRVVATQPNWRGLILATPKGVVLVNTQHGANEPLPPIYEPESFATTARTGRATVGTLAKGTQSYAFALRVAVPPGENPNYVLSAVVSPDAIAEIVRRQQVADDWLISVFDSNGVRVARSREHDEKVGSFASESLRVLMARSGNEGMGVTQSLEGDTIYTAYTQLPSSKWTVAIGIPVGEANRGAARTIAAVALAVVFSILFGVGMALVLARRINESMARVRETAEMLGRRAEPAVPETEIREVHDVGAAISAAAQQRMAIEVEIEDVLRREREARGEAEAANRAKDAFLAMLGHELRNPLAALSNASSLLDHAPLEPRVADRAREVIQRQVGHLARLTDDLLEAARALLGKIELRRAPIDLALVARQALHAFGATGRLRNHRVIEELGEAWVEGDPVRLDQIVPNLIGNAVKYTPPTGTITVRTRRDGAECVLTVSDDGVGMTPDLVARAFDLFVQGDRELHRSQGGLGIGLTLVRRLAELHGGSAEVLSEGENRGCEFTVRIPAMLRSVAPTAAPPRAASRPLSILVIEDNDDARETLQTLLELMGHRVDGARDGISGVQIALASRPDVAFVDLGLPGMDGYEVARRLRAEGAQSPYLIALTGYGAREDRDRALGAGFDAHVTKPVAVEQLDALLATAGRQRVPA